MRLVPVALLALTSVLAAADPAPKVVTLDTGGKQHQAILSGAPETATMRSGYVVLQPGKGVGRQSNGDNEELLVVLEGAGEFRLEGGPLLPVVGGSALYCPPGRTHDVFNTGQGALRYVYVTASAKGQPTKAGWPTRACFQSRSQASTQEMATMAE